VSSCRALRLLAAIAIVGLLPSAVPAGVNTWTSNGPSALIIRALTFDPTAPSILYAGAEGGGVHRSLDGGDSWADISDVTLASATVLALAVDANAPATIYAGTDASGIFITTDGGTTWAPTNSGLTTLDVQALAIDPTDSSVMYAGTDGGGVFKSLDAGGTWTAINVGLVATVVNAITIDPTDASVVYAGVTDGVSKSIDAGASWTDTGIAAAVLAVAIDPSTPATVYAGTVSFGAYKSTTAGSFWSPMNAGLAAVTVRSLTVAPDLPTTVYAGTPDGGVFLSLNSGASWVGLDDGLTSGNVQAVILDPIDTDLLHAGTLGGGVFDYEFDRCTDGGGPIVCGSCETCDPAFGCIGEPAAGCRLTAIPEKSRLIMKNDSAVTRDRMVWKWSKGSATSLAAFGDPTTTTAYEMCMFDESGPVPMLAMRSVIPPAGTCKRGKPCWKAFKDKGFRFRDGQGVPDGITKLQLKEGESEKAKVLLKGSGAGEGTILPLPDFPLGLPVRMQLRNDLGECWEAVFTEVGLTKNDGIRFHGKSE